MADRHRTGDAAHSPQPVFMPASVLGAPLRPMPAGVAYKTFPKRHAADLVAHFGRTVRAVRMLRAFSQIDLAARAGVHRSHISLIESGAREARLATICTLAAALRVNPGELLPALFPPEHSAPTVTSPTPATLPPSRTPSTSPPPAHL